MTQTKQPKTASKSSSHTPGPWHLTTYKQGGDSETHRGLCLHPQGQIVARLPIGYNGDYPAGDSALPNARLIAAAPEMYELLSTIIDWYENSGSTEPCAGSVDLWSAARRIKAAIDGEV